MAEYSTSLSDALLALCSLYIAWKLCITNLFPAIAFTLIALAATCGCLRFAGIRWPSQLISWHKYLSWASGAFGVPCIVVGYCRISYLNMAANILLCLAITTLLIEKFMNDKRFIETVVLFVNASAVLTCLYTCLFVRFSLCGCLGIVLYVLAGTVVKTEGYYGSIPKVDIFHYMLAIGNVAFFCGFL